MNEANVLRASAKLRRTGWLGALALPALLATAVVAVGISAQEAPPPPLPDSAAAADQELVTVEGEVLVRGTGVPLDGAIVVLPGLGRYTFSDELGYFRFDGVPPGDYFLRTIRLGYETLETNVPLLPGEMLVVYMSRGAIPLEGVTVTVIGPDELAWRTAGSQMGLIGPVEMEELSDRYLELSQVFASRRIAGTRYVFGRALGQPGCLRSARARDTHRAPDRRMRGAVPGSLDCAAVVVDGVLLNPETASWVYELDPSDIFAVRFLNATDAASRYGHTGRTGVLVVETRVGRRR